MAVTTAATHTTRQDALTLLEEEHRAVEKLFDAFERADDDDLERKSTLVQRACELLTMHAMVEEEILYPAAKEALGEDNKDDVNEAVIEHFLVKTLIEKFSTMKAGDEGFNATFKVLTESVNHHVEEEESELFPELRKTKLDLGKLGERIATRREALQGKITKVALQN
ncbi:hemerythrin domain-containing protein [Caballeronia sp. 15715]|uniref:hemerythrin domain-containing protein n=1 Tax=unclassified Caballeronia TaxID=2646786 RepID=UPI0039E6AD8D